MKNSLNTNFAELRKASLSELTAVLFVYFLIFIFVSGVNPFANETLAPTAILKNYSGWGEHSFKSPSSHPERSDILDAFIPQYKIQKNNFEQGDFGVWNFLTSAGRPGYLDPSRSIFSPVFLAFYMFDDPYGYYIGALIKLIFCAAGMFYFLRQWLNVWGAFFGGLTFAFCGFNISWFYWPQVNTSMWIPWFLAATSRWYAEGKEKYLIGIFASYVFMFLGGFPAVAVYASYAGGVLVAFYFVRQYKEGLREWLFRTIFFGLAVAFALVFLSIFILNLREIFSQINLDYRGTGSALKLKDLPLLLFPYLQGLPRVEKTGAAGILATCAAVLSVIYIKRQDLRMIAAFGVTLILLSVLIAFQIIPRTLLELIPGVEGSPTNRLLVIYGVGVAISAAVFVHGAVERGFGISSRCGKYSLIALIFLIFTAQIYQQKNLFSTFNVKSSSSDFYPSTSELNYVKENISPLQSVIADGNFMLGGTLGYYGLREWFAHDFKTDNEKRIFHELVDSPFRSPTAMAFSRSDINFESDIFSRIGVKYILVNESKIVRKQPMRKNIPGKIFELGKSQRQYLNLENSTIIERVGLYFATYRDVEVGDIYFSVKDAADERTLGASLLSKKDIKDNLESIIEFDAPIVLNPGEYILEIEMKGKSPEKNLTVWMTQSAINAGDRVSFNDGSVEDGAWMYKFYGDSEVESGQWKTLAVNVRSSIRIMENKKTPKGPYFINSLGMDEDINDKHVSLEKIGGDEVIVNYTGMASGFVVIPLRWFPGWYVDSASGRTPVERYLGMVMAHRVNGPERVVFKYKPDYINISKVLMFLSLIAMALLMWGYGKAFSRRLAHAGKDTE